MYPVFHALLLEPTPANAPLARIMDAEKYEDQNYYVEKVLDQEQIDGQTHYFVKWKEYPPEENT